jgi:hypothetical protein
MRFVWILCSAALVAPTVSAAQAGPVLDWPIVPGSRVRILSPVLGDQKETGSVVSATSDTLVFRPATLSTAFPIATPNIVGIEVARGTHSRKVKGALLGFLAGAGAGAIIGYASYKRPACSGGFCLDFGPGFDAALASGLGGILGTVAGTIVGARQTDTWVPVAIPRN